MTTGQADTPSLSDREKQCLTYLALGLRIREMADKMGTSSKTAEKQIACARKKIRRIDA